ncbi:MAG: STAS domain-containing protein [Roseiflexaceae bacterium]
MQITQRQSVIGLLGLLLVGGLLVIVLQLLYNQPLDQEIVTGVGMLVVGGLLIAYWRGWDHARHAVVVIVTLLLAATMTEPFLTQQVTYSILIPPVIALVFTRPAWILGSAAVVLLGLIARAGGVGVYVDPITVVLYILVVGGMVLARLVLDTAIQAAGRARRLAEETARALEQANAGLEAQVVARTAQLQARTDEQARLMAEQAHLLDELDRRQTTIRALSVPVIPVSATTIIMPLIGALDADRLRQLQWQALRALEDSSARQLVLDITGVPLVDRAVAQGILMVVRAARLLGAEVMMVGIRPEVAQALVELGLELRGLRTYRDLASALGRVVSTNSG